MLCFPEISYVKPRIGVYNILGENSYFLYSKPSPRFTGTVLVYAFRSLL